MKSFIAAILAAAVILSAQFAWADSIVEDTAEASYQRSAAQNVTPVVEVDENGREVAITTNFADPEGYKRFERQLGGGDSGAAGDSGDAGAGASSGGPGGDSGGNGDGCSR